MQLWLKTLLGFVSERSKQKPKSSSSAINQDDKESSEPDYNDDKDKVEDKQEEQTVEITTTNQTF